MVAMDFFAASNSYDFFNQYCSNLLKNPTVRGLTKEIKPKNIFYRNEVQYSDDVPTKRKVGM